MLLLQVRDEILSISPRELYRQTTIPEALEAVFHYAADKPQRVTVSPNLDLAKTLSGMRDDEFLAELLRDTEKWLQLFYFGMLYRTLAHIDEIVAALNQRVLFRVPIATRALLELFFVLLATYKQIYRLWQDMRGIHPNEYQKAINNGLAIRDLLLKQVRATRINWDNPFGDDWEQVRSEIKQTNILSMLDKLPTKMRDPARRWYGILSDICHPNFGSILYVLDHESVREQPPTLALARVPNSHIHLEMTVELVSAPLAFACLQQISFLSVLDRLLTHYREGIQRFGGRRDVCGGA